MQRWKKNQRVEVDVARESRECMKIETRDKAKIPMTKLDGMTNDQMMSKRFDLAALHHFNAFTLQDVSIPHWPFRS
jgi:hypothetical protein